MTTNATKNYRALRAALLQRGTSLNDFARRHGFRARTVYAAARRQRHGRTSLLILKKLEEVSGE